MPAMTLDNTTICRYVFVGMAHSYGIVATNLMAVKRELGNQFQNPVIPAWMPESSAMDGNIPIL